jgi:hypothetical protein
MTVCTVCGEELPPDRKVCDICGTSVPASPSPSASRSGSGSNQSPPPVPTAGPQSASTPAGRRVCSLCHATYGPEHDDEFCHCGGELVAAPDASIEPEQSGALKDSGAPGSDGVAPGSERTAGNAATPPVPASGPPVSAAEPVRPPAGTDCIVVYSEQKKPIHYCAIDKDVTIIGRSDPVRGDFPDLDLAEFFDPATARKISRKHAIILRLRDSHAYLIRPLGGNTGTQIDREMAEPLRDYPLTIGTRMILGGMVRLKFEKMT